MYPYGPDAPELCRPGLKHDFAINARSWQFSFIVEGNVRVGGSAPERQEAAARCERPLLGRALWVPDRLDQRAPLRHPQSRASRFAKSSSLRVGSTSREGGPWHRVREARRNRRSPLWAVQGGEQPAVAVPRAPLPGIHGM